MDKKSIFTFFPLDKVSDSLILLENYGSEQEEQLIEAKAILRIFWLLGGGYSFLGVLSFLPGWFFNWSYRLVAKNRF
jgi:predicted DCC family thiol-disulfide oxidoreductase YuxK